MRSAKSWLSHPARRVEALSPIPSHRRAGRGGPTPLAQGKASQRCCVTRPTLNPSALLLQPKSHLPHPWAAWDRFKSPIPTWVSYAVLQEKAAKAALERVPAPLFQTLPRGKNSPRFWFPSLCSISEAPDCQTGALARVPAPTARMDVHRLPMPVFFITLLITFINCITASPSQAISNFKV